MPRHLVLLGPNLLPTDGMIYEGTRYLLGRRGQSIDEYVCWSEKDGQPTVSVKDPTHIIIMGTPWLWDRCHESPKYRNIINYLDSYPTAKVLFFGIGTCFPINKFYIADDMAKISSLNRFFKDHKVIGRDTLVRTVLPDAELLPCPAYYALYDQFDRAKDLDLTIWYDPTIGLSRVDFQPGSENLAFYLDKFKSRKSNSSYCVVPAEQNSAINIGYMPPIIIENIEHAKELLLRAKSILSGRVHLSVPAYDFCPDITLVPVDSRAKVLYDVKQGLIQAPKQALPRYDEILKEFLS